MNKSDTDTYLYIQYIQGIDEIEQGWTRQRYYDCLRYTENAIATFESYIKPFELRKAKALFLLLLGYKSAAALELRKPSYQIGWKNCRYLLNDEGRREWSFIAWHDTGRWSFLALALMPYANDLKLKKAINQISTDHQEVRRYYGLS